MDWSLREGYAWAEDKEHVEGAKDKQHTAAAAAWHVCSATRMELLHATAHPCASVLRDLGVRVCRVWSHALR